MLMMPSHRLDASGGAFVVCLDGIGVGQGDMRWRTGRTRVVWRLEARGRRPAGRRGRPSRLDGRGVDSIPVCEVHGTGM